MLGRIFSTEIVQASTDDTNLPTDDQILGGLMQETTQEDEDRIQLDDSEVQELISYLNEMQCDLNQKRMQHAQPPLAILFSSNIVMLLSWS